MEESVWSGNRSCGEGVPSSLRSDDSSWALESDFLIAIISEEIFSSWGYKMKLAIENYFCPIE